MKKILNNRVVYYNDDVDFHREDGPDIEYSDGTKHWCINGKRHRTDGPAVLKPGRSKSWFINGLKHRS